MRPDHLRLWAAQSYAPPVAPLPKAPSPRAPGPTPARTRVTPDDWDTQAADARFDRKLRLHGLAKDEEQKNEGAPPANVNFRI